LISLFLAAMAAVFGVGLLLSRFILKQVEPLLAANRRFGSGGLSVRAPILSEDEIGELARGFNAMADRVQAGYEKLEERVFERTEELTRLNRELQDATKNRTELYAMVSHEFRSPLAAIIGHAELLLDDRRSTATDRRKSAWSVKLAGEELLARTNELLDLAKLESGTMRLDMEEVALTETIEQLHGTASALAERSELAMRVDVPEDVPNVRADGARLRQIILNLLSNAAKYTPPGGTMTVAAIARRGLVEVSVSDTGVGIPKGTGDRVFDPFYQVPGNKAQKGQASTGLGLALTKQLVEAHGGTIWYHSSAREGTTFAFTLRSVGRRRRGTRSTAPSRSRRRAGVTT
jgi:signal transduction histidine kinase